LTVEIPLTKGYVALVDDIDAERTLKYKWHINGRYAYCRAAGCMQHFILGIAEPSIMRPVHHKDTNGLNNTRGNLIVVNIQEHVDLHYHYKYKGVLFHRDKGTYRQAKYMARICIKGKRLFIGRFATAREAAEAYNRRAIELLGPDAFLNDLTEK